jgi:hypothetical protein
MPRAFERAWHSSARVVRNRKVQQRLAAEQRERELLWARFIEPLFDPVGDARRRLETHLRRELVVIAVIALEAVVAREVALQRGQHGDLEVLGVLAQLREVLVNRTLLVIAALDHEAVFDQRVDGVTLVGVERGLAARNPIEQSGDIRSRDDLRVGKRVHQEQSVALRKRHLEVVQRRLHTLLRMRAHLH